MSTYRKRHGAPSKLPEFTKNLNASQRGLLTKFTRTGERDMTNRKPGAGPKSKERT